MAKKDMKIFHSSGLASNMLGLILGTLAYYFNQRIGAEVIVDFLLRW